MIDQQTFLKWAKEAGFFDAALCSVSAFAAEEQIVAQQQALRERRQLRFNPIADYPQARSLGVMLWGYEPATATREDEVFVDNYYLASNAAYHAARKLETRLTQAGCFACANVSYPAKSAAVRAGLGLIGQNDLLITKKYGTRVVIILMATDLSPENNVISSAPQSCMRCGQCSKACPSGALSEQGMTHPERCLRNYMMEGIVVPETIREKMGNTLIGCDVCQRVCPMQPAMRLASVQKGFLLTEFMTDDPTQFAAGITRLAGQIGRNTARPQRVRAQAALLAGNSRNPAYLPVLEQWAQSAFDAVREHARWAAEKIREAQKSDGRS